MTLDKQIKSIVDEQVETVSTLLDEHGSELSDSDLSRIHEYLNETLGQMSDFLDVALIEEAQHQLFESIKSAKITSELKDTFKNAMSNKKTNELGIKMDLKNK